MREIVLDTETTGMEPSEGHRLVEIGCVELFNHVPTGRHFHKYLNPERDVHVDAVAVHGLTWARLKKEPVFSQVYIDLVEFIGDGHLVIHNAAFDMKFLNWELSVVGHPALPAHKVVDTLALARQKFPGSPASLDALCRRFGIDNSGRELHGALLDAQLLAEVYLEMKGGRQHGLGLTTALAVVPGQFVSARAGRERPYRDPRPHAASAGELAEHAALVETLGSGLWAKAG